MHTDRQPGLSLVVPPARGRAHELLTTGAHGPLTRWEPCVSLHRAALDMRTGVQVPGDTCLETGKQEGAGEELKQRCDPHRDPGKAAPRPGPTRSLASELPGPETRKLAFQLSPSAPLSHCLRATLCSVTTQHAVPTCSGPHQMLTSGTPKFHSECYCVILPARESGHTR